MFRECCYEKERWRGQTCKGGENREVKHVKEEKTEQERINTRRPNLLVQ